MARSARIFVSMPLLATALVLQSAGAPLTTLASVPVVERSATPFPDHVTIGHLLAFDVRFANVSGSNVARFGVAATFGGTATATYQRTIVHGTAGSHTTCTAAGTFSCDVGNFAAGETLALRVIFRAPADPGTVTATFVGTTSGQTQSDGGQSHGDSITTNTATVNVFAPFSNGAVASSAAYIPDDGDSLATTPGVSSSNPLETRIDIPGAAVGMDGFTAFIEEADYSTAAAPCPLRKGCYGQASHLTIDEGATLAAPFTVQIVVDNAKSFRALSQWQIVHVTDDGTAHVLPACDSDVSVNCVLSKNYSAADRTDYVAVLVLDSNGYIRNG